jgi:deferrochelatase/peroxidase EfeB
MPRLDRRSLLGVVGAGSAAGVAGWALGSHEEAAASDQHPFHGTRQAGIVTPAQDRLYFAAFDVVVEERDALVDLLRRWTRAAALLTGGRPVGESDDATLAPVDTGEAAGLPAARLTLTFGVGRSLFQDARGRDRFGLADRLPDALRPLPHFAGDDLDHQRSDGDLCVQACADDPQVAVHAVRNLARLGFGTVALRWAQLGFGRTSRTSIAQETPRNLFGFKDGTANLTAEDPDLLSRHVWVGRGDDPRADWLAGGSYLVARRVRMHLETWDRTPLSEQQDIIGRERVGGAPLSGGGETTPPDFGARHGSRPAIPPTSHVFLAHPDQNAGQRMLRRGYTFADGNDDLGRMDAGLFFLAYVRDPHRQYVPMQARLATDDALSEYLTHTRSGLWAVPPGVRRGGFVGETLFGQPVKA